MKRIGWVAAAAAVSLLMGACSSSGDSRSGRRTSSGPTLNGAYKIMTFGPFSTAGSQGADTYDQIQVGAQAAANVINDSGGVNGKAIQIEVCDSKGDSNQAVACAQKAVQEHLPAVVGNFDLGGDYLSVLAKAKVPALGAIGLAAEYTSPVAFPVYNGLEIYLGMYALFAEKKVHDVAFPFQNAKGVEGALAPIIKAGEDLGLNITKIPVEPDQSDFSPVVARARSHQGIIIGLVDNQSIPFVQTLRQTGYTGPVAGSVSAKAIKTLGGDAEGLYSVNAYLPASDTSNSAVKNYVDAVDAVDSGTRKDDATANAYNSVLLFAKAVRGMTDVTGPTVLAKLKSMGPISTGLRPPTSFGKPPASVQKSFPALTQLFDVNVVYEQVKDGDLQPINGEFHDSITGAAVPLS